jgi:hypothetical protein
METRPAGDAVLPAAAPEKASVLEDFIEIFYAPSRVFERRRNSGFGLQLLIVTVLAAAFAFAMQGVMSQIMDAEFARSSAKVLESNPQMTQDMLNKTRGFSEAIGKVMGYIGTPIMILVLSLFVWLGARIASAKISYGQAALITTLAWVPRLVGMLIGAVQAVVMDTTNINGIFSLSTSPARFLDPDTANPKLYGLLGNLDVFAIWSYVLMGIGIAVVGHVPRGRGLVVATVLFVLGSVPLLLR